MSIANLNRLMSDISRKWTIDFPKAKSHRRQLCARVEQNGCGHKAIQSF
jgi:hypothetical protein